MSETTTLTSAQSKTVRNLHKTIINLCSVNPYTPNALQNASNAIVEKFRELEVTFPEAAKAAAEYYEAELPDMPEETDGYEDALFNLLVELNSFANAKTFLDVTRSWSTLREDIYSLATFSNEFNAEGGYWNVGWA